MSTTVNLSNGDCALVDNFDGSEGFRKNPMKIERNLRKDCSMSLDFWTYALEGISRYPEKYVVVCGLTLEKSSAILRPYHACFADS